MVACGLCVGFAPQHDNTGSRPGYRAGSLGVESPASPVGRQDAALRVRIAVDVWHQQAHAARQGDVAVARGQGRAGERHRAERRGAAGLHGDGRTVEAELEGEPRCQEVLFVRQRDAYVAGPSCAGLRRGHVLTEVVVLTGTDEHPDNRVVFSGVAGVLQRLGRHLQQHALLRIHDDGFGRLYAEVVGVERLDVAHLRNRSHERAVAAAAVRPGSVMRPSGSTTRRPR